MNVVEYPKRLYNKDGRKARVLSVDDHARFPLSDGWAESPAGPFEPPQPPAPPPRTRRPSRLRDAKG